MTDEHQPTTTETPGPRTRITLDVAEESLPQLIEGMPAVAVQLVPNDDGTYTLRGTLTMGVNRARGVKPIADVLVECLNDLVEAINASIDDVPQSVLVTLDAVTERYENYSGERVTS